MTVETEASRKISDDEIREDIMCTEYEIRAARRTIELAEQGIREREEFVAKLRAILAERSNACAEIGREGSES